MGWRTPNRCVISLPIRMHYAIYKETFVPTNSLNVVASLTSPFLCGVLSAAISLGIIPLTDKANIIHIFNSAQTVLVNGLKV